jgi:hypothetical protein
MGTSHFGQSRREFLRLGLLALPALVCARAAQAAPVHRWRSDDDLDAIASEMTVIPRATWNRESGDPSRMRAAGRYTRITIHHAGMQAIRHTSRAAIISDLNRIREAHLEQRYGDIGYHLIVDYAGRVWEGRSLAYEGAHVLSENEANVGVMLLGNFERQQPSLAQLAAMAELVELLRTHYGIRRSRVYGHRDLGSSVCPGRNLYPYVAELRQG